MIGLSTKLQERMALNTGRSVLEFVSNVIIMNDAIHAHKEAKKRKVVTAPSGSAPPRYRMVYHHSPTYPPPTSAVVVGPPPTSAPEPADSTQGSTSTTTSATPACATDRSSHYRPHLFQLWLLVPFHSRVSRANEEHCSWPHHPSTTWSVEGGCCKDQSHQLYHYGGYS
jgi:hypothetical protein